MRKKFLKVIAISSLMLTCGGVMAISQMNNRNDIQEAKAADGTVSGTAASVTISNNGMVKKWDFASGTASAKLATNLEENGAIYIVGNGSKPQLKQSTQGMSWKGKSSIYFEVPSTAFGSVAITTYSSSNGRYLSCLENASLKLWSKFSETETGSTGPQSFDFTSSDLGTYNGKTYLRLQDNDTEMKVATLTITLNEGVTENFNGSVKQKFSVSYFDKNEDGTTTEYTSIKANEILEGNVTTKPTYVPTKVGYEFANWTLEDGTVYDFATPITSNLSLYASWNKVETFKVTFDYGYNGLTNVIEVNPNSFVAEPETPIHPEGDAFVEWQLNGVKYDFATPVTSNITLIAKWDAPVYAESITIEGGDFTFAKEELDTPKQLKAIFDDTVNTNPVATWASSNEKVATVDSNGNVTAVSKGETTITATIYAGTEHEKQASIKVIVPLTNLSTENKTYEYDFQQDARALVAYKNGTDGSTKDGESKNYGAEYNGEKFGIFTLKVTTQEAKWFGTNKSGNPSIFMTGGTFEFTVDRPGKLVINATCSGTKTLTLNETETSYSVSSSNSTATFDIPTAGTYNLSASGNVYYKQMKFVSKEETNWVDTEVHLGYQVGKMNASSEKNDSVKFVGYISKEALYYLKDSWFEITINDGTAKATEKKTTVYSSIGYYDAEGNVNEFTPATEHGATTDFYYFAFTLTNIPSTFTGTISARAFVEDANGNSYVSAASADVQF